MNVTVLWSLAFLAGLAASATAVIRMRTKEAPDIGSMRTYHPRNWLIPVWKQQRWFTPTGFVLYVSGIVVMVVAGVLRFLT